MKAFVINIDNRPERYVQFKENNLPFDVERISAVVDEPRDNGCAKSHLGIIAQGHPLPFFVFEDDCLMLHPWPMVEDAMSQLPDNWDMLWLGATLTRRISRYSENLFRLKGGLCTHAMAYGSQRVIDFILNNFRVRKEKSIIDLFYATEVQERFNCFIVYPIIATQREGYSDVALKETGSWIIKKTYEDYTR